MTSNETLSQNAQEINADTAAYLSSFENGTKVFSSGVVAARAGYGERAASFSDVLKANNSLPPTMEQGVER